MLKMNDSRLMGYLKTSVSRLTPVLHSVCQVQSALWAQNSATASQVQKMDLGRGRTIQCEYMGVNDQFLSMILSIELVSFPSYSGLTHPQSLRNPNKI